MALPNNPPFSMEDIANEVGLGPGSGGVELLAASVLSNKSLPAGMDRFAGYAHVPTPPDMVTAVYFHGSPANIRVSWSGGQGDVDNYRLEKREFSGGSWGNWTLLSADATGPYNDFDFTLGNTYVYRVRAENAAGVSDWRESPAVTPINP